MKRTEEKILKAATKLFSEYGYNGVSTKKIALEAGVNEITLFRHFKSKSNLLQSVITHFAYEGNIIEKISKDITGDIRKDLYIFAEVYYMFLENNIKMYKIQIKEISEEGVQFTNSIQYREFLEEYLSNHAEENEFTGDPAIVSASLVSMIMGIFTLKVYSPKIFGSVDHRDLLDKFVNELACRYIKKENC